MRVNGVETPPIGAVPTFKPPALAVRAWAAVSESSVESDKLPVLTLRVLSELAPDETGSHARPFGSGAMLA